MTRPQEKTEKLKSTSIYLPHQIEMNKQHI